MPDPMEADQIRKVTVVGGGTMGNGIAQVVLQAGLEVTLVDISEDALEAAQTRIDKGLGRSVKSGRIGEEDKAAALASFTTSTDLEAAATGTDHLIETVIEDLDVKLDVLKRADQVCADGVVFASNTSQFPISRLAGATGRPDRVIGSHWFNPPPLMDLIEIVRGVETSDETLALALDLAGIYGRQTVVCQKDTQGFITSRLMVTLALEAGRIVEEGVASAEDVNRACVKAFNHAMGPLDTVDFSGLDVTLRVADSMRETYGERFLAPQGLRTLVDAGHIGRKSGRGYGDYSES